jgi:D-lactate dehydrogenase
MKSIMFSTHEFDEASFAHANKGLGHDITFVRPPLSPDTAKLALGYDAVIVAVEDQLTEAVLQLLSDGGTKLVALRIKGFDNVDLAAAQRIGLRVVRVPDYSPHSVAEHVFALALAVMRHIPESQRRTRDENFKIDGLLGSELYGKTFGIVGVGRIGLCVARIAYGFGCDVIAFDVKPPEKEDATAHITYLPMDEVVRKADILSLHAPLTPQTRHLINAQSLTTMKHSAILINAARGGLVDTNALIEALKARQLRGVGIDVYEQEAPVFNRDLSNQILTDDVLARLLTLSNVVVTSHMAFLTEEALKDIAETTLASLAAFGHDEPLKNEVKSM